MNKFDNNSLEAHLRSAVDSLAPNNADAIWNKQIKPAAGNEWFLKKSSSAEHKSRFSVYFLSSIAAVFVLLILLPTLLLRYRVDARVFLDVNPSVELDISYTDRVIRANALNPDGALVLEDAALKHADLDDAIDAILSAMASRDFLSDAGDVVLISVESRNSSRAESLRAALADRIKESLTSETVENLVLSQTLVRSDIDSASSAVTESSPGQATLLNTVLERHPELNPDELNTLSISALYGSLLADEVDLRDVVDSVGQVPERLLPVAEPDVTDLADDFLDDMPEDSEEYYEEDEEWYDDSEDYYDDSEDYYDDSEEYYEEDEEWYDDSEEYYDDSEDYYDDSEDYYDDSEDYYDDSEDYYDDSEDYYEDEYYDDSGWDYSDSGDWDDGDWDDDGDD